MRKSSVMGLFLPSGPGWMGLTQGIDERFARVYPGFDRRRDRKGAMENLGFR